MVEDVGVAGGDDADAAAVVAGLSAVALQLLSGGGGAAHRGRLRSERIPADVIWLDIDYQLKNRPFTVDPERFPTFDQMIKDLKAEHFHTVVITDLHIADQPNIGYKPYDEGDSGRPLCEESRTARPMWASCGRGRRCFPDFTQKASRDWWGTLYKDFVGKGVAGFWNDMNEPAIFEVPSKTMPDDVQHRIEEPGFITRTTTTWRFTTSSACRTAGARLRGC